MMNIWLGKCHPEVRIIYFANLVYLFGLDKISFGIVDIYIYIFSFINLFQ